jgi:hypothetical protein
MVSSLHPPYVIVLYINNRRYLVLINRGPLILQVLRRPLVLVTAVPFTYTYLYIQQLLAQHQVSSESEVAETRISRTHKARVRSHGAAVGAIVSDKVNWTMTPWSATMILCQRAGLSLRAFTRPLLKPLSRQNRLRLHALLPLLITAAQAATEKVLIHKQLMMRQKDEFDDVDGQLQRYIDTVPVPLLLSIKPLYTTSRY